MTMQFFSSTRGVGRARATAVLFAACVSLGACLGGGGGGGGSTSGNTNAPTPSRDSGTSVSVSLSADPIAVAPHGVSRLTWSVVNAESCTASGGWGGVKSSSGYESTTPLAQTTEFTLTCVDADGNQGSKTAKVDVIFSPDRAASLSWSAPTKNTDGSTLTDLQGFNVYAGTSASTLQRVASTAANVTTHTVADLSSGTHYFAVSAVNSAATEGPRSNVVSKAIP